MQGDVEQSPELLRDEKAIGQSHHLTRSGLGLAIRGFAWGVRV